MLRSASVPSSVPRQGREVSGSDMPGRERAGEVGQGDGEAARPEAEGARILSLEREVAGERARAELGERAAAEARQVRVGGLGGGSVNHSGVTRRHSLNALSECLFTQGVE